MAGFTYYDEIPNSQPTTQEILASLSGAKKIAVLDGFIANTPVTELKHKIGVPSAAIRHLYEKIDAIEEFSKGFMRSATGTVTAANLLAAVIGSFSDDFSEAQISVILSKMVEYSKHDGTGNWDYYSTSVVQ